MLGYIFIVLAGIFLGTIGIFVKLAGNVVNPFVLGFYRVFFAFLLLLIISPLIDSTTFNIKKKNLWQNALIGFLFAINFGATVIAYRFAPVQNVALILSTTPAIVLIFAYFMLKEKITKTKVITLLIVLAGLFILNPLRAEGFLGNIIALAVAISGGLMFVLMRKINSKESIGNVVWFFGFATLFLLPFPIIYGFGKISLAIIALGIVSTGAAYLFYNMAYETLEAETGNLIANIINPVTAVFLAVLILGEGINIQVITGGVILIVAGIYLKTHTIMSKRIHHH